MKVLVTGGCGYVGARLTPFLLADGHIVDVVDTQGFGAGDPCSNESLRVWNEDCRDWSPQDYREYDAIIHLASLSQNDMYAKQPEHTRSVNRYLPIWMEHQRFIYASSVAAYGTSQDVLTEDSPLKPTTPYGEDKAMCDERVLKHGGICVRSASVAGHSPNMRFDTPVNSMTRDALNGKPIRVNGGKQIRCHVHIDDLCQFYRILLTAPKVSGAFNVMRSNESIEATAYLVRNTLADDFLKSDKDESKWAKIEVKPSSDERSYQVSKSKAIEVLNWTPSRTLSSAIEDMRARFDAGNPQYREYAPLRMRML